MKELNMPGVAPEKLSLKWPIVAFVLSGLPMAISGVMALLDIEVYTENLGGALLYLFYLLAMLGAAGGMIMGMVLIWRHRERLSTLGMLLSGGAILLPAIYVGVFGIRAM